MKLAEIARMFSPTVWILGAVAAVALLLAAWWMIFAGPAQARKAAAEARASAAYSAGRADSAAEAAAIVDQAHSAAAASEELTRKNADEIRSAPGADVRLDPALNHVGRERLCLRPEYSRSAGCAMFQPDRAKPSR